MSTVGKTVKSRKTGVSWGDILVFVVLTVIVLIIFFPFYNTVVKNLKRENVFFFIIGTSSITESRELFAICETSNLHDSFPQIESLLSNKRITRREWYEHEFRVYPTVMFTVPSRQTSSFICSR